MVEPLPTYDAGLLSDHGGGDVEWWQDYIRAELGRAHDFYASQWENARPAPATEGDREVARRIALDWYGEECKAATLLADAICSALTNARNEGIEEAAVAARGNQAEHLDCEHPDGYWDGRSDAEHAVRALRRPE